MRSRKHQARPEAERTGSAPESGDTEERRAAAPQKADDLERTAGEGDDGRVPPGANGEDF